MRPDRTNGKQHPDEVEDPATLALFALAWILADERRADRLLALTGLDAGALKAGIENPAMLGAVLSFLADHEPDLIACAEHIEATPAALIEARKRLGQ